MAGNHEAPGIGDEFVVAAESRVRNLGRDLGQSCSLGQVAATREHLEHSVGGIPSTAAASDGHRRYRWAGGRSLGSLI